MEQAFSFCIHSHSLYEERKPVHRPPSHLLFLENLSLRQLLSGRTRTMALTYIRSLRNVNLHKEFIRIGGCRTFAVGKKKGGKGGAAGDAPKASKISKEVKASTVVGANILKDGVDPKVLPDSEYPDWLWHLLDKRPALSELRRKDLESLPYDDLKRFVKLDTRARIKENNSVRAKN
ncbi:putative lanC-like protein 2-like [Capsicum annuum]|nr:putative lanC-like protein 2-like [Capsicum annuum]KAF3663507.1 putative lanC-like protein 2-like [Capsicum annuum]